MKVLVLGWEYPPHISGGLGTACQGLTIGIARQNVEVTFVVPHLYGGEQASHMVLTNALGQSLTDLGAGEEEAAAAPAKSKSAARVETHRIPSLLRPYFSPADFDRYTKKLQNLIQNPAGGAFDRAEAQRREETRFRALRQAHTAAPPVALYGCDIFSEVERFATNVVNTFKEYPFDLIHAHDWMTFPAAILLSAATGRPFVAHVHSLETDRSGEGANCGIVDIERHGLRQADAVIAVSEFTKRRIADLGVDARKVSVVHNGVTSAPPRSIGVLRKEEAKTVLFLGRVTFQKGPDYFVEAAAKVHEYLPNVKFVLAGDGDMLPRLKHRVHELGLSANFEFPGFLHGAEVARAYASASLYVMPSVSEPFGIAPLEAIKHRTPVIISKQSGVSEVLRHALKVDFWDIERLAELMIVALLYPELGSDLLTMAQQEVKRLRWDKAGAETVAVFHKVANSAHASAGL